MPAYRNEEGNIPVFEIKHLIILILDFAHIWGGRADHPKHLLCKAAFYLSQNGIGSPFGPVLASRTEAYIHHTGRWGILHQLPVGHLLPVKALIILGCRASDCVMLRAVGLNHHFSRRLIPARPARRLGEQLEGALAGRIIFRIQGKVGRQHTHQRDFWEIMALDNHLCADQDIRFLVSEGRQDLLMPVLP